MNTSSSMASGFSFAWNIRFGGAPAVARGSSARRMGPTTGSPVLFDLNATGPSSGAPHPISGTLSGACGDYAPPHRGGRVKTSPAAIQIAEPAMGSVTRHPAVGTIVGNRDRATGDSKW